MHMLYFFLILGAFSAVTLVKRNYECSVAPSQPKASVRLRSPGMHGASKAT